MWYNWYNSRFPHDESMANPSRELPQAMAGWHLEVAEGLASWGEAHHNWPGDFWIHLWETHHEHGEIFDTCHDGDIWRYMEILARKAPKHLPGYGCFSCCPTGFHGPTCQVARSEGAGAAPMKIHRWHRWSYRHNPKRNGSSGRSSKMNQMRIHRIWWWYFCSLNRVDILKKPCINVHQHVSRGCFFLSWTCSSIPSLWLKW